MSALVEARIKKSSWLQDPNTPYFPIFCGRVLKDRPQGCGGALGRVWRYTARKGSDLSDIENWIGGMNTFSDWTSIGAAAMRDLVVDASRCHIGEARGGEYYQLWLAEHEQGYRRLKTGDYQVLQRRSAVNESQRVLRTQPLLHSTYLERPTGRRPMPPEMADLVRYRGGILRDGAPMSLGVGGTGVVGEVPPIPSVILCPKCGERNRVEPLVFDERSGMWHTVHTE
jgi:hypothetical protein